MARKLNLRNNWLFNKQGLDWWHILIIIGVFVGIFFVPVRTQMLDVSNVEWVFVDASGNEYDPTTVQVLGGFGYTNNPQRLQVANQAGTTLLIHPPYGPGSTFGTGTIVGTKIKLPKSKITLVHRSNCEVYPENDGVTVETDQFTEEMYFSGKQFVASEVIVYPNEYPNCDWVWFKGQRQQSIFEWLYESYFKTTRLIIPAQPFSVIQLETD